MGKQTLLDKREVKLLKLILKEKTNQEIAEVFGLSKRTIEGLRLKLMRKTKAKNMIGLLKWAINNDVVHVNNRRKPKLRV